MSPYRWDGVLVLIADGVPDYHGQACRPHEVLVDGAEVGEPAARPIPVSLGFSTVRLGEATLRWAYLVDLLADIRLDAGDPNVEWLLRADLRKVWPCLGFTERRRGAVRRLSVDTVALCTEPNADWRVRAIGAL